MVGPWQVPLADASVTATSLALGTKVGVPVLFVAAYPNVKVLTSFIDRLAKRWPLVRSRH